MAARINGGSEVGYSIWNVAHLEKCVASAYAYFVGLSLLGSFKI